MSPANPSIEVGETVQLQAQPVDGSGDPVGGSVSWTAGDEDIASVSATGLVTGVAVGSTPIRATADGVTGSVTVTVTPEAVGDVVLDPDSADVPVGTTLELTATTLSAAGDTLADRVVSWTSSNTSAATVSGSGLVTGIGDGVATVTATSEGIEGSATIVVFTPTPISIDSVSPALLVEGAAATLHGSGFAASIAGNAVTVDGFDAEVTAATETQLDITVPATGCRPDRNAPLVVSVGASTSPTFDHPIDATSDPLELAIGEQAILRTPDALCVQLAAGAAAETYVVGVQSTSSSGSAVTPAQLVAVSADGSEGAPIGVTTPLPASVRTAALEQGPRLRRLLRHRRAELELRARERDLIERLVDLRAARPGRAPFAAGAAIPPDAAVGDTVQVRVPDVDAGNLCSSFFTVDAEVRVIGSAGVWLTDVTNPAAGYSDADLEALSDMFDDEIYATDVEYLGDPTDLDGNGRIAILTTRRVNATQGLLGFVFSGDLFSTGSCASSNEGEIYYGIAPDPDGEFGDEYAVEDARLDAPSLIAHEFAHILQNANGEHAQEVWEAEGQATFIEEVVGFATQGRAAGNDYGFDIAFNEPATDSIDWYLGHFFGLATYYGFQGQEEQVAGAPEQCSWLVRPPNGPCFNDARLVYDVPKSLLRYITDQFAPALAGGEPEFHQALLASSESGLDAIEDVTGVPIETVLARWAASLYVDGRFGTLDSTLETTTWDLFDIWSGLVASGQLVPRARSFGSFSDDFSVRGGSNAYFTISGNDRPAVAVEARSQSGAELPSFMQLWIVRVQ